MKFFRNAIKPEFIASQLKGDLILNFETELNNVAELSEANNHSTCFYQNEKYFDDFINSNAGLIFVPKEIDTKNLTDKNLLKIDKPYFNFMLFVRKWMEMDKKSENGFIHETAVVSKHSEIADSAKIMQNVVIKDNAKIGANTIIEANTVIMENSVIGENCHLYPNSTIYPDSEIGNNVIIHSGAVIGSDGFGYLVNNNKQEKIPQVGNVVIHNNVEIGANTTIDRATIGKTIIGNGTKIDNLVQIGHNCKVGKDSVICAQVGLAGSTQIGNMVYLAGQVGAAGHLKVGDKAMIGAQSGIAGNVPQNGKFFGTPAIEARTKKRIIASEKRIPEMIKFYRKLKKRSEKKE